MNFIRAILLKYKANSSNIHAIAIRYGLYAFGLLDSLLLPKLIDSNIYSGYEYYKNAIFLFPNIMLGAYSGYMYVKYSKGYDLYDALFKVGMTISLFASIVTCMILKNAFLFIPLLAINFYVIIEQRLKVNKEYISAFLFKPLLSIFILIFGVWSYYFGQFDITAVALVLAVFVAALLVWFPFIRKSMPKLASFKILKFEIKKYKYLVRKILTGTLASLVFGFVIFFERFLIDKYYPESLAEYSFVFNLAQIMVIVLSVFSYISSVEFGENLNTISKEKLLGNFIKSIALFLSFYLLFVFGVYGVSFFYSEFQNILWMAALLAISKGFFFFVGIYSPIAVYKDFNTRMLKTISTIFLINVICAYTLVFQGFSIIYLLILNAVLIITYSLYILDIVFRRVKYIKE